MLAAEYFECQKLSLSAYLSNLFVEFSPLWILLLVLWERLAMPKGMHFCHGRDDFICVFALCAFDGKGYSARRLINAKSI